MMSALHTLLQRSVDYAGLFPPASLAMQATVDNYARYHGGPDAWLLGRLIVPAARLPELELAARDLLPGTGKPWQISALVGTDVAAECDLIAVFNARHGEATASGRAVVDTVELKAETVGSIRSALGAVPHDLFAFVEIPVVDEPAQLLRTIHECGGGAKIRTGGTTPDAFPTSAELVRFVAGCAACGLPFKATAGLHHPLRSEQALTDAPHSPRGMMWGFVTVLLATALIAGGGHGEDARRLLDERDPAALRFAAAAVRWRDHVIGSETIQMTRRTLARSFGSCSFMDPLADLRAMELL